MNGEFEQMDKEMMETLQGVRDQKMPEGLLKDFSAGVERKIRERNVRPAGIGAGFGWASALALGLVLLVLGAVIWKLLPAKRPIVVPVKSASPTYVIMRSPGSPSEIVNEIEALKELGVWTDEDEEKLGIALEETFSELELAFDDNSQIPGPAMAAG